MEITKKQKQIALYSIPILIGLYLIYRQFKKATPSSNSLPEELKPIEPSNPRTNDNPLANDSFPLKQGSRDKGAPYAPVGNVVRLQKLLNQKGYIPDGGTSTKYLVEDGIFGPKTEAALKYITNGIGLPLENNVIKINLTEVESPKDFDYLNYVMNPYVALNPYAPKTTSSLDTLKSNF
jgi:hypothetical protein